MGGFLQDKAAEMMADAMESFGIEPGELLKRIEKTLDLIDSMLPVAEQMAETSEDLEDNVNELQQQIGEFNKNSSEMVDAMEGLAETLDKYYDLFEDVQEKSE